MLFTSIATFALSAIAVSAAPTEKRQTLVCSGTYSNAVCCATDVLGVADLNCVNPKVTPTSADNFVATCAAEGQQAKCCALPILGQALICQDPVGV
ncbi:hypothetical protein LTR95_003934 [Oleoguttula sp. CCFEE 5521]